MRSKVRWLLLSGQSAKFHFHIKRNFKVFVVEQVNDIDENTFFIVTIKSIDHLSF